MAKRYFKSKKAAMKYARKLGRFSFVTPKEPRGYRVMRYAPSGGYLPPPKKKRHGGHQYIRALTLADRDYLEARGYKRSRSSTGWDDYRMYKTRRKKGKKRRKKKSSPRHIHF